MADDVHELSEQNCNHFKAPSKLAYNATLRYTLQALKPRVSICKTEIQCVGHG